MPTLKEGRMYKRGKVNPDWKQRTFVLDDKRLCYFKGGVSGIRQWLMLARASVLASLTECWWQTWTFSPILQKSTPAGFINLGDIIEVSPFLDEGVFQVSPLEDVAEEAIQLFDHAPTCASRLELEANYSVILASVVCPLGVYPDKSVWVQRGWVCGGMSRVSVQMVGVSSSPSMFTLWLPLLGTRTEGLDWRQAIIDACHQAGTTIKFWLCVPSHPTLSPTVMSSFYFYTQCRQCDFLGIQCMCVLKH